MHHFQWLKYISQSNNLFLKNQHYFTVNESWNETYSRHHHNYTEHSSWQIPSPTFAFEISLLVTLSRQEHIVQESKLTQDPQQSPPSYKQSEIRESDQNVERMNVDTSNYRWLNSKTLGYYLSEGVTKYPIPDCWHH